MVIKIYSLVTWNTSSISSAPTNSNLSMSNYKIMLISKLKWEYNDHEI